MNLKYESDIREIVALIDSTLHVTSSRDYAYCESQMTAEIDDAFLMDRAACIHAALLSDDSAKNAFGKISTICNKNHRNCESCPVAKYCNAYIQTAQVLCNHDTPRMIDLFCGAGGLSLGFTQAGYVTSLANDIEPCCIDTYTHNHPEIPRKHVVLGDINGVMEHITDLMRFSEVDILVGGPPCQGFSMANRQRLIDDPRNHLYKSYIEVLKIVRPRFFVMENVKGMLAVSAQIIEDFERVGYAVSARIINAKDCGVPQNRERLIFIGNSIGIDNELFFRRIEDFCQIAAATVLGDALYGLTELKASRRRNATEMEDAESGQLISPSTNMENDYIRAINQGRRICVTLNHKARYNNDRDIEIFGRLNPGDRSDDPKIADIMPYASRNDIFKDKYYKLEMDKVCKTITAHMKFDCNMYIHPTQARGLTPREAARVQSFPDDYFFRGAYTKTYMQIGNSVPPLLGRIIALAILPEIKKSGVHN